MTRILRKLGATLCGVLLVASTVLVPVVGVAAPPATVNTLLNAVTSTGAGISFDIGFFAYAHTCVIVWGGTTPTNTVVKLEGSIDGTNWGTMGSEQTVTSSPWYFSVIDNGALNVRGNYVSKSGGDGTTSVTLKCVSGGLR